jgi:hypothetical protein
MRRRTTQEPSNRGAGCRAAVRRSAEGVKLSVYKHLLDINAGFNQVVQGLAALRRNDASLAKELDRYSALVKEARAATNSYLIGVLEPKPAKPGGVSGNGGNASKRKNPSSPCLKRSGLALADDWRRSARASS